MLSHLLVSTSVETLHVLTQP